MTLPGNLLLVWRVMVLFTGRRNVQVGLLLFGCIVWAIMALSMHYSMAAHSFTTVQGDNVCGCWPMPQRRELTTLLRLVYLTAGGSTVAFQATLILLTIFNPHTLRQGSKSPLIPILRVLRIEFIVYGAGILVTFCVTAIMMLVFADRPLAWLGNIFVVGCQTIGNGRLYLHIKSKPWSVESATESDQERSDTARSSIPTIVTVSTSWSSARSSHEASTATRHRHLGLAVGQEELDSISQREASEVIASLAEE